MGLMTSTEAVHRYEYWLVYKDSQYRITGCTGFHREADARKTAEAHEQHGGHGSLSKRYYGPTGLQYRTISRW